MSALGVVSLSVVFEIDDIVGAIHTIYECHLKTEIEKFIEWLTMRLRAIYPSGRLGLVDAVSKSLGEILALFINTIDPKKLCRAVCVEACHHNLIDMYKKYKKKFDTIFKDIRKTLSNELVFIINLNSSTKKVVPALHQLAKELPIKTNELKDALLIV